MSYSTESKKAVSDSVENAKTADYTSSYLDDVTE